MDNPTEAFETLPRPFLDTSQTLPRHFPHDPTEAFEELKAVLKVEPANASARANYDRLERESKQKLEQRKEEVMGKMKELGNTILGKFGMSLDNFKAEKNPETGAYNISFQS